MLNRINSNQFGEPWSIEIIVQVWFNAKIVSGLDEGLWREDSFGHLITFFEFGNRKSTHGWEINHITSIKNGGNDEINNLQALYWKNNDWKAEYEEAQMIKDVIPLTQ